MLPVEILDAAETELREAADYYARERSAAHRLDFLRNFASARRDIQAFPKIGPVSIEGTRCKRLKRFPYSIFYLVRSDRIVVVAVANQHRRPGYWVDRLRGLDENAR